MLNDCLNFLYALFHAFFTWLGGFTIFTGVSYLSLIIGAFIVYLFVDNFVMKGK